YMRYLGNIEIPVPGSRFQYFDLQHSFRRADPSQSSGKLDKQAAVISMNSGCQVPEAGQTSARGTINAGKIGGVIIFAYCRINTKGNRYKPGDQQTGSSPGSFNEVLNHFRQGPANWVCHIDIAHRSHNNP